MSSVNKERTVNVPIANFGGLSHAVDALAKLNRNSRIAQWLPIPLVGFSLWSFSLFMPQWWKDPFVDAIMAVFVFGQLLCVFQHRVFLRGSKQTKRVLLALTEVGKGGFPAAKEALSLLPSGHLRDLMLRVLVPLRKGETALAQTLLDSAANRRSVVENRRLGQHIGLNRTILKLGFLGTLIGLLWTFPPMKNAILALTSSDGELKFMTDIAHAIDGDYFAIFTTLIATGLSILVEMISIQLIERSFGRFENMNSHAEEWLLSEATPDVGKDPSGWSEGIQGMQSQIHQNLSNLADMVRVTTRRIDDVREMQEMLEQRFSRLKDLSRETDL